MRKHLLLLALITSTFIIAQDTCESPEESLEDLNSITKCSIKEVKKTNSKSTRQISVRISAPNRRYLKKRSMEQKSVATSANSLNVSGISKTLSTNISKTTLNIKALTNNLSTEEVRKASSFNNVDNIPAFTNCESVNKGDELACFNKEMIKHVEKHFSYPNEAVMNKTEGKVWIRFIINKEGTVTNIKTLGPKGGELLNAEAVRVISKLPRFKAGTKNGKRTAVKYGLPIQFSLDN